MVCRRRKADQFLHSSRVIKAVLVASWWWTSIRIFIIRMRPFMFIYIVRYYCKPHSEILRWWAFTTFRSLATWQSAITHLREASRTAMHCSIHIILLYRYGFFNCSEVKHVSLRGMLWADPKRLVFRMYGNLSKTSCYSHWGYQVVVN